MVRGALNAFADHVELYWNAIGTGVIVPVEYATVRVTVPAGTVLQAACFRGERGSTVQCAEVTWAGSKATFGQADLNA
ncbi:MAG: DUF2207 domain-containing protein [Actinobacteria bacterium]|nr:DUF2207 domain-containing protein [Actinomycetota bacterium]